METPQLTRITPVKGTMPGSPGCIIRYSIDHISNPELAECIVGLSLKQVLRNDICVIAEAEGETGRFVSSAVAVKCDPERDEDIVAITGTYTIEPDYRLLSRIARWKCGFSPDEAVTKEDFMETYGPARGGHFYEKWISFDRGIEPMIGYFGNSVDNGQAFLGMVMKRVYQFEKREMESRK
jgi:hypothetical protein